jgi:hypothetical protein
LRRIRISTGTGSLLRGVGLAVVDRYVQGDEARAKAAGIVDGVASSFEDGVGIEIQVGRKPRRRRLPKGKR